LRRQNFGRGLCDRLKHTVGRSRVGPFYGGQQREVPAITAHSPAVLASAVVDDDPRLGEADQGILRVWAVMVGPVPWIAGLPGMPDRAKITLSVRCGRACDVAVWVQALTSAAIAGWGRSLSRLRRLPPDAHAGVRGGWVLGPGFGARRPGAGLGVSRAGRGSGWPGSDCPGPWTGRRCRGGSGAGRSRNGSSRGAIRYALDSNARAFRLCLILVVASAAPCLAAAAAVLIHHMLLFH
jgi:hypothetical protein